MKKFKKAVMLLILVSFLALSLSGCYGTFTLTKKLYKFNGSLGAEPVKTLAMWVMMFIPIYQGAGFIDLVLLNTMEYWTGKNPLAMNEGQQEIKYVSENGKDYKVVTSKNRYDFYDVKTNDKVSFVYNTSNETWTMESNGKSVVITDNNNGLITMNNLQGKFVKTVSE